MDTNNKQVKPTFDKKRNAKETQGDRTGYIMDEITRAVIHDLRYTDRKGQKSYGEGLSQSKVNGIQEAYEELIDGTKYLKKAILEEQLVKRQVNKIIDKAIDEYQGMETSARVRVYTVLKDIKEQINNL